MNETKIKDQINQETNTFTKAPVVTQIIAYVVVFIQFLIFTICIQVNISSTKNRIVVSVLYYLSFIIMLVSWIFTSKIDPSDSLLYR